MGQSGRYLAVRWFVAAIGLLAWCSAGCDKKEGRVVFTNRTDRSLEVAVLGPGLIEPFPPRQVVPGGDVHDRVHVRHLPVEMHGEDGAGPLRNRGFDLRRIDVERDRVDVHEHRLRPGPPDAPGRAEEREGRRDHLVAAVARAALAAGGVVRADLQGHQAHQEGVGAAGDAQGVLGAAIPGRGGLEIPHGRAVGDKLRVQDFGNRGQNFLTDCGILLLEVEQGNLHGVQAFRLVRRRR